jgi:acyl-coenzyme A thioesterase PaaI-like protein
MNYILKMHQKAQKYPMGNWFFNRTIASKAPYFKTIKPQILEIRHNYINVFMKKRPSLHNHLKTIHAIASCNLCEFAAGICMEASIPKHRRWIPVGMEVAYQHKAETDVTASCDLSEVDWENCSEVDCQISVLDTFGKEVVKATITMKVSDRKKR